MNENVVSLASARCNRAAADAERLGAEAYALRKELRQVVAQHAVASLDAEAIELSDVSPQETRLFQLTNQLVWFEAEAERIRLEYQELEASMRKQGVVWKLDARLPAV